MTTWYSVVPTGSARQFNSSHGTDKQAFVGVGKDTYATEVMNVFAERTVVIVHFTLKTVVMMSRLEFNFRGDGNGFT